MNGHEMRWDEIKKKFIYILCPSHSLYALFVHNDENAHAHANNISMLNVEDVSMSMAGVFSFIFFPLFLSRFERSLVHILHFE